MPSLMRCLLCLRKRACASCLPSSATETGFGDRFSVPDGSNETQTSNPSGRSLDIMKSTASCTVPNERILFCPLHSSSAISEAQAAVSATAGAHRAPRAGRVGTMLIFMTANRRHVTARGAGDLSGDARTRTSRLDRAAQRSKANCSSKLCCPAATLS